MGLKNLGRVGTQIFFFEKKKIMHFEKLFHKIYKITYFQENLEKFQVSPINLSRVGSP